MNKTDNSLMVSCRKAVSLDEKGKWTRLSFKERVQLRLHQGICVACKRFEEQSQLIEQAIVRLSDPSSGGELRNEIKDELIHKLNKSKG